MKINSILCGDSASVLSTFPSQSIDLVVTDPPYLCNYRDRSGRHLANDESPDAVFSVFPEIYRVMKPGSYCISFYGWTAIAGFAATWEHCGFRTVGHIVWPKPYVSRLGFAKYQHESAFILAKSNPAKPAHPIDDVQPWEYSGNDAHPTEKAVNVIEPLIRSFSRPRDIVLDPFSGSGSTAVAAALNNRRYIGVELEQRYCDYAERRLLGVRRWRDERYAA